jgi:pimeloyl-ACP methyl ester carboxylesterase
MPSVIHRGQRIEYSVEGAGPLVILQHGLLLNAKSWKEAGIVDVLSREFCVACVDSLGHGLSDKPSDPQLYSQKQRSGDIVAVIDDLGYDRAHLIGHSMGGWLGVGVAKYHPDRLSSLVIGGWHPVSGLPAGPNGVPNFVGFMNFAKRTAPTLAEWVTEDFEPGVQACFEALGQLEGAQEAIMNLNAPVIIWDGYDDPHHHSKEMFAAQNGLQFLSTAGDHLGMLFRHGEIAANGLREFLKLSGGIEKRSVFE